MKRNLDLPLLQLDGSPFADAPTLKALIFHSITSVIKGDDQAMVETKLKMYRIAQKVAPGGVVDLEIDELAMIKDRIGKACANVIAMGRSFELLEQDVEG